MATAASGEDTLSPECLRIVLIGGSLSGKSCSGNAILRRRAFYFNEEESIMSFTTECCIKQAEVDGRPVAVVDTPGLHSLCPNELSNQYIEKNMSEYISLLAPGPHVFLLVISIDERPIPSVERTLKIIKEVFGTDSEKFTIILFTRGDQLEHDKLSIDEYIEKCDESLKKLISDCGGRYHVFNNCLEYTEDQNVRQVRELVEKINTMVNENGGSCYTREMLQEPYRSQYTTDGV